MNHMIAVLLVLFSGIAVLADAPPAGGAEGAEKERELRVMSYNVRNSRAHDGENGWAHRKGLFFKTIEDFGPDLLGTQEVLADQYDDLVEQLPGYEPVGVARDDGKRKGEWSLILFKKDRFELLDSGTFWLSERPGEVGSKSWDAALTRICSWAVLKDRKTGREFVYGNTHFDHVGKEARRHSAELLVNRLPELAKGRPVVLTGDFNCYEVDPPYAALTREKKLVDSYREVHPVVEAGEASFHAFKGTVTGKRIDWILHSPEWKAESAEIVRTKSEEGRYPSDHYPVTAVLQFVGK